MSDEDNADLWNRRRKNLRALIAYKGTNSSQVCKAANLSVNTLSKFMRGETHTLRWETLERICKILEIPNAAILDSDNPFSESKTRLYELIEKMTDEQAEAELERFKASGLLKR
ncbi:helix-turn-helix domain-containing protein [Roseibium polysiphoniae]|uniref:Helix-turn-helix transcriptional regulator n=1 Tax=Roseibium polysiphoniae TaxID=2571221 RepID=A0ABR9C6A0_9HYPH|nr:helix-turn-helix transcriptional regulator [Roseibium polysiphoniae]MBD8875418.1 helix-turn-helix transcriptional regulator [Roseibium polysiphoniae]